MAMDPLHQFEIKTIVPISVSGIDFSFTNASLWMLIGVVVASLTLLLGARREAMVPGRFQAFTEMFYEFVAGMLSDNAGPKARSFFPFVFSLFVVVLMGNMLGMLPYAFTYTSHIAVTGALALFVFLMVTVLGFAKHGLKFFGFFLPEGVPLPLAPFIYVLELFSYLTRPLTLAVRLFANMLAGHLILKVFAGFSVTLGLGLGFLPLAFNVLMVGFEFLIAFLQAYVFAVLSCIYIKDSLEFH